MKNLHWLKLQAMGFLVIIFSFSMMTSCKKEEEEKEVDESLLLTTNTTKHNGLALGKLETWVAEVNGKMPQSAGTTEAFAANPVKRILIKEEVAKIFAAENQPCPLPEKILKKLKGKNWAPDIVTQQVRNFPDSALLITGTSLSAVMNTVIVKKANGQTSTFPVLASPSFQNFDVSSYLITGAYDNFFYTLDCSGYMNAAIQFSAAASVADMSANATSALKSQSSMFVGGGTLAAPIYSAYYDNAFGTTLDKDAMWGILNAVSGIPNLADTDSVILASSYYVVWASSSGTSGFNGSADISGKAGIGVGVASFSAKGDAGGTVSRQSKFAAYATFVIDTERMTKAQTISVAGIRKRMKVLKP